MLEFNPDKRLKASQLIKNKIFDPIRVEEVEKDAPYRINLGIDPFSLDKN